MVARLRALVALIGLDGAVAALGAGLVVYGLAMVFPPAAYVAAGAFLLALALWRL